MQCLVPVRKKSRSKSASALRATRRERAAPGVVWSVEMDIKTARWIHSADSSVARFFLTVTLALAIAAWSWPALAESPVSDRIERAKTMREIQVHSIKSNKDGRILLRTPLDRSIERDLAASADRRWRSLLAAQQRERAVQPVVSRTREVRGLAAERARRATDLSGKIRRHGIEQQVGVRP